MRQKILPVIVIFIIASCSSQTATPTVAPTSLSTETSIPAPTATSVPTETASPVPTLSDIFGAIPLNSVQAFSIEPVAKAIFDQTLQGYVTAGTIQEFRVDSVAVFPSGNGGLIAEIMYSPETEHQLKNKRLCS
jgi:hypothetical protein